MTDLWSFTDNFSSIRDEYWSNKNDPRVCDMWMDWDSDWDHGADWQVLPVFVSEEIVNTRYGDAASWWSLMKVLSWSWPETWKRVFADFDQDRVSLAAFSRLGPNQELEPHEHKNEGHLIFHMGMEIPEGDVGIQTSFGVHQWKSPEDWVIFDDTKTHSAWNRTEEDRVIFYMDFMP